MQVVEWTIYFVNELSCVFNILVRLLLFDNIKQSLKVVECAWLNSFQPFIFFLQFGIAMWMLSFVTNYLTLLRALFVGESVSCFLYACMYV